MIVWECSRVAKDAVVKCEIHPQISPTLAPRTKYIFDNNKGEYK
jgi:hypothetical protein